MALQWNEVDIAVYRRFRRALYARLSDEECPMVPGMTERERLITDAVRLDWLTDARLEPVHTANAFHRPRHGHGPRLALTQGLGCRIRLSVLRLIRGLRMVAPRIAGARPTIADAPSR
jgi:hypothetical protein